jgi:GET complex subunit GET2
MQEEYLKALLRGPSQSGAQGQAQDQPPLPEQDDPMIKMLGSLMGGMSGAGDPNAPGGLPFNPEDLSKATGMPSFLTNMLMGNPKAPPAPAEIKSMRTWRVLHVVFALLSGLYYLFAIGSAEHTFGANPPAPATFQNPFLVFLVGEILLQSTRILTAGASGKRGPRLWYQMVKDFAGDGAVIVFLLGVASWWKGVT